MRTSIIVTNTATDVSIKCVFPSILAINYSNSMLLSQSRCGKDTGDER